MFKNILASLICSVVVGQDILSENNMLLLQPYLEQTKLGYGIEAYQLKDATLVPLGEICNLLGFGITVDPIKGVASGFFIDRKRTFVLDLDKQTVEISGTKANLTFMVKVPTFRRDANNILIEGKKEVPSITPIRTARDIYVDSRSLSDWFPLEAKAHPKDSVLIIKGEEKLPIQETWELSKKSEGVQYVGDGDTAHGTLYPVRYSLFDLPVIELNTSFSNTTGSSGSSMTGDLALSGDLLWMSSDIIASRGADGSWEDSKFTLFREDPTGNLLGIGAKSVVLGDLMDLPSVELLGDLPQGRGFSIDNFPLAYRSRFSTKTFRGALNDNWSVEIFQNEILMGFQRSRQDGLYEFKDVPLRFGINNFKLVFHGPHGETIEKTSRLDISQDLPSPGVFYYGVAGVDPDNIDSYGPRETKERSYLVQGTYGINSTFSAQAGLLDLGEHTYGSMGLWGVWPYLSGQFTVAQDKGPVATGRAYEALFVTGLGYSTVSLKRGEFSNGFLRPNNSGLGVEEWSVENATELNINWSSKLFGFPVSITGEFEHEEYLEGLTGTRERLTATTQYGRTSFSNSVSLTDLPNTPSNIQGTFTTSSFLRNWSWNISLDYDENALSGWSLVNQYNTEGWQYQLGFDGTLGDNKGPVQVGVSISKLTGRYGIGTNLLKTEDDFSASIQFQVSLGREPLTGRWVTDAQSLTSTGAVSALAFLDKNGNGLRDSEEKILEGTRFKVGGGDAINQISDSKVTLITKLPTAEPVDVALDESSLEDSAQEASGPNLAIIPRPGKVMRLEFPVSTFGSIDGTTRILKDGKRIELGGLEVEVVNAKGERVKVLRSSYDGFFEFISLPYGTYTLRVTPEEVKRMKIKPVERLVIISDKHNFLNGQDLVVEPERITP